MLKLCSLLCFLRLNQIASFYCNWPCSAAILVQTTVTRAVIGILGMSTISAHMFFAWCDPDWNNSSPNNGALTSCSNDCPWLDNNVIMILWSTNIRSSMMVTCPVSVLCCLRPPKKFKINVSRSLDRLEFSVWLHNVRRQQQRFAISGHFISPNVQIIACKEISSVLCWPPLIAHCLHNRLLWWQVGGGKMKI